MAQTSEIKNGKRKNLTIKDRRDRFVAGYVQSKYPDIYREANVFYEQLGEIYPNKKDRCKTIEYLRATEGVKSYNEYYRKKRPSKKKGKHTLEKSSIADNMVLEIPLFNTSSTAHKPNSTILEQASVNIPQINDQESALIITDDVYEGLVQELRQDPDLYRIFNDTMYTYGDDTIQDLDLNNIGDEQTPLEKELAVLGF